MTGIVYFTKQLPATSKTFRNSKNSDGLTTSPLQEPEKNVTVYLHNITLQLSEVRNYA
jgi:hypothetical protein